MRGNKSFRAYLRVAVPPPLPDSVAEVIEVLGNSVCLICLDEPATAWMQLPNFECARLLTRCLEDPCDGARRLISGWRFRPVPGCSVRAVKPSVHFFRVLKAEARRA